MKNKIIVEYNGKQYPILGDFTISPYKLDSRGHCKKGLKVFSVMTPSDKFVLYCSDSASRREKT